jgi:sugar phosphate isomerase/epimerase
VRLSLENSAAPPDHRLEDVRWALQHFDTPSLGTNVDFANYAVTDQDPIAAIRALAPWLNYVHAKDARRTPDGWRTTYLGNGELRLREILRALDATGKPAPFCLEFPGEGDPEGAIQKSLSWLAAADRT